MAIVSAVLPGTPVKNMILSWVMHIQKTNSKALQIISNASVQSVLLQDNWHFNDKNNKGHFGSNYVLSMKWSEYYG